MLKLVIAIVVLGLAVAIGGPLVARGSTPAPARAPAARIESAITDEAPVADEAPVEVAAPPGPVDDLGEEESSPPGPIDDLGTEEELSPPGPIDDLGVAPVTSAPTRTTVSLAPPMDPTPDVSASPDAGLPLPRSRTQQALDPRDGPDTESHRTEGDGAARLAATPFDEPIGPSAGIKDRLAAGAR